jgi:hypothetical protein
MVQLKPNEKIILSLHKHWVVLIGKLFIVLILALAPIFISLFLPNLSQDLILLILFFVIIYFLFVFALAFVFWIDYYLDVWIITNQRIIDIEQRGLFKREISEFMLNKVQDVTIKIPGMMAALLKYGDITVQTAGERNFAAQKIPNIQKVKNLILYYSHSNQFNQITHNTP